MKTAFCLWHRRVDDEYGDNAKFVGVYSSEEAAKAAVARLSDKPGFVDYPQGFEISPYPVDKDHWVDGFISWEEASA